MRTCFTKYEWMQIYDAHHHQPQEWTKERVEKEVSLREDGFKSNPSFEKINLEYFMKFWCLKESYIKAIGIGLGLELQDFFFHQKFAGENTHKKDEFILHQKETDAEVCVKNVWLKDWIFKQTKIDIEHPVAIAYGPPKESLPTFLSLFPYPPPDRPSQTPSPPQQPKKNFKFNQLLPSAHVFQVLEPQDLFPQT